MKQTCSLFQKSPGKSVKAAGNTTVKVKRTAAGILSLALLFSLIPTVERPAFAAAGVAEIVETGVQYTELQNAFDVAEDGQTIKLLTDIMLTSTITVNNSVDTTVTLDLKGKRQCDSELW